MKGYRALGAAVVLFVLDRATKWYAVQHLCLGNPETDYLCFRTAYNPGVSWGILSELGSHNWPFFALLVSGLLCMLLVHTLKNVKKGMAYHGELLVITGGLSNLIDRFFYHSVVDFISIQYKGYEFPVFNCADVYIVIGVVVMILSLRTEQGS